MKYIISCCLIIFLSCDGDKNLTSFLRAADIPISSAKEINTVYTDSGIVSSILNSPKMLNFSNASFPYFEFPERIEVILFDKNNNQTKIISDYAISYSNTDLIDLRGNVVVSTHLQVLQFLLYLFVVMVLVVSLQSQLVLVRLQLLR